VAAAGVERSDATRRAQGRVRGRTAGGGAECAAIERVDECAGRAVAERARKWPSALLSLLCGGSSCVQPIEKKC